MGSGKIALTGFQAGLGLVFFSATTALTATTGAITLAGTVPRATAIVVTGSGDYNALDLETTTTDLTVASVREINNTAAGYAVTLTSTNGGKLKNGTVGEITYTAKYDSASVTLSTSAETITTGAASSSVVNVTKAFSISYTGADSSERMEGTYSDDLTFTISAN